MAAGGDETITREQTPDGGSIASTIKAGSIVTRRRRNSGIMRSMKPCITT